MNQPEMVLYGVVCIHPTGLRTIIPWMVDTDLSIVEKHCDKRTNHPNARAGGFLHVIAIIERNPDATGRGDEYREKVSR
jgi:hypothetical protein